MNPVAIVFYVLSGSGAFLAGLAAVVGLRTRRDMRPPSGAARPGELIEANAVDVVQLRRAQRDTHKEVRELRRDIVELSRALSRHAADGHGRPYYDQIGAP